MPILSVQAVDDTPHCNSEARERWSLAGKRFSFSSYPTVVRRTGSRSRTERNSVRWDTGMRTGPRWYVNAIRQRPIGAGSKPIPLQWRSRNTDLTVFGRRDPHPCTRAL